MTSKLTRLVLENWRNFRSVNVALGMRAFVVGPNAAGKTNLFDAIRFLQEIARPEGSLARAVTSRGGIAHLRSLHARQASHVRVQVTMSVDGTLWEYELVLSGTKTRPFKVERERVAKGGRDLFAPRPNAADRADPRLLEQTHLEQLSQNTSFRPLADALASVAHIHVVPQLAKLASRSEVALLRDAPGSDFIDQIAALKERAQKGALGRIGRLLRVAVPQFSELRIEKDPKGIPHLSANYRHWRPQGSWQNEAEFSDGTLRLIGFLWAIIKDSAPLLIEEPELSLHRDVVRQIPRLVAKASQLSERQIILSTHAEEMLNDTGVDPAEIILLTPTDEETRVTVGASDELLVRAARDRLPLGALVTGKTRPHGIEQLSLNLPEGTRS